DAARTAGAVEPEVPEAYAAWTSHRPPVEVPRVVAPDPALVTGRSAYSSWRNISHAASLPLPYYASPDDWGVAGFTSWVEPLGKHFIALVGAVSLPAPLDRSYFAGTYVNNQWYPSIAFSAYRLPGS